MNDCCTYTRILNTARQLMHTRSYAEVGVAAICEQANVRKGSFYHHFASKQALTLAILDHLNQDMQGLLDQAFDKDISPLERLERFAKLVYEHQSHIKTHTGQIAGCPFGNLASELATLDEAIRCKLADIFRQLQLAMQGCLQEAITRGELPQLNVEATAQAMFAYLEGVMLMAKTHNDPAILRELLPAIRHIRIPDKPVQQMSPHTAVEA